MLNHTYLKCVLCGDEVIDDGLVNEHGCESLLRAVYNNKQFVVRPGNDLFKFSNWLPISRELAGSSSPITYRSENLSSNLGLDNLFITFSGFWEEKSALMETCTFKECEAYAVLSRFPKESGKILVVATAGNTGRAFIKVASDNEIPLVVVIPKDNIDNLWGYKKADCVKIVATGDGSDYTDVITLAGQLCQFPHFVSEGGAKNVARRDGMGTVMLSAAQYIGDVPDYYFQAVGSGTGAIAVWEANMRLIESGFTKKTTSLQLSQNAPFLPLYNAWKAGSQSLLKQDPQEAKAQIAETTAQVLTNRTPPYAIVGGLYDALKSTSGDMWAVTNDEIASAQSMFLDLEGCDICPEAGAALASLRKAVADGVINKNHSIVINITGGGFIASKSRAGTYNMEADMVIPLEDIHDRTKTEELAKRLGVGETNP